MLTPEVRTQQPPAPTRPAVAPLPSAEPEAQVDLPESLSYRVKRKLLGPPLHTERLAHERLGKPTALAVFASDNLSSSAYATEEILRVAHPGGRRRRVQPGACRSPSRCWSCSAS